MASQRPVISGGPTGKLCMSLSDQSYEPRGEPRAAISPPPCSSFVSGEHAVSGPAFGNSLNGHIINGL